VSLAFLETFITIHPTKMTIRIVEIPSLVKMCAFSVEDMASFGTDSICTHSGHIPGTPRGCISIAVRKKRDIYCNVFFLLKPPFGLLTGLFNNLPVVTTIDYYKVTGLHTLQTLLTNLFTLSSVVFTYSQRGSYPSLCELHTPNIAVLQYSHSLEVTQ
jgi:hypothetical protein